MKMEFEIKVLDQFVKEKGTQEEKDCWDKIKAEVFDYLSSYNRYRKGKAMRTKKEIKDEILRRKKNSEEYFIGFVQALLWVLNEKPKIKEVEKWIKI
jgi:hypothetical protein